MKKNELQEILLNSNSNLKLEEEKQNFTTNESNLKPEKDKKRGN